MSEEVIEAEAKSEPLLTAAEIAELESTGANKRFSHIYDQFAIYRTFQPGDVLIRYSHSNKTPDQYSNTAKTKRFLVVHVTDNGLVYTKAFCSTGDLSKVIVCISDVNTIGYYRYEQDANIVDAMFIGDGEYSPKDELKASINKIRKLRKINYPNRLLFSNSTNDRFKKFLMGLKLGETLYSIDDKFEEISEWNVQLADSSNLSIELSDRLNNYRTLYAWNFGSYDGQLWFKERPTSRQDLENGRTKNK